MSVAVCDELTAATDAVNAALVAFAATVTDAGTVTAVSLLARLTLSPPEDGAAVSVTVQASDPAPVMEEVLQETLLTVVVATPAALMFTTTLPWDELLVIVRTPVNMLTIGDVNFNASVAVCPGLSVAGMESRRR